MTCHLFLDNFTTFGLFSKVWEFLKQNLVSRKLKYLNLISWDVLLFWILSFAKDVFITENWLCFRACNSRIVYIWSRIFLLCCGVILRLITFYGIFFFEKFPLKRHYHGVVENMCSIFEIVSLKGFEWVYDQIIFFPVTFG